MGRDTRSFVAALCFIACLSLQSTAWAQEPLFRVLGPPDLNRLPEHAIAGQRISINQRAFQAPSLSIELFGETHIALRTSIDRSRPGESVWVGHLEGNPFDTVILVQHGRNHSGFIQLGLETYRITAGEGEDNRLLMLDLQALPADDVGDVSGGGLPPLALADAGGVVQDLLVVYNQAACNSAGGCAQLEADIVTAVADLNAAYAASGIDITMNLAGTHLTSYTGTGASQALSDLRGTSDGQMDEIHAVRDAVGADIVSFVYDGEGCGIGYLPASASYAFNVTDEPCLVGNRTMAHEIGHNQGAHHDRVTAGAGTSSSYNYGYRRCNDTSVDAFGSPYFRTVMSYSCSGAPRVGRFSNPYINYLGVPQGVDPAVVPGKGAWNQRVLNDSAVYVASFRTSVTTPPQPPATPTSLGATATGPGSIDLSWTDGSADEEAFVLQRSTDGSSWSTRATLPANSTGFADNGLQAATTYFYRVRASNAAGVSAWSNTASATTDAAPSEVVAVAQADVPSAGSVSGSYLAIQDDGGAIQSITETSTGGPKRSRQQSYRHGWDFDVLGGAGGAVVTVDAWVSNGEAANFYYSLDGGASRTFMFSISDNAPGTPQVHNLPPGTSGTVRIEVQDAELTNGEGMDTVSIDHLFITSYADAGDPPAAPSALAVVEARATSVTVSFNDNADDEFGFELRRALANPLGNCDAGVMVASIGANPATGTVNHTDETVDPSTTYWYWAKAFNGAGDGGSCSNAATATTATAPTIDLAVSGSKQRGFMQVNLQWSGATSTNIDVWRNGTLLKTIPNSGALVDDTGQKGSATWTYQVCHAGTAICSNEAVAIF